MSDTAQTDAPTVSDWTSGAARARVQKRYRADRILKYLGLGAILLAVGMLGTLLTSIFYSARTAWTQTHIEIPVYLDPAKIKANDLRATSWRSVARTSLGKLVGEKLGRRDKRSVNAIPTDLFQYMIRDYVAENPDKIGQTVKLTVPTSDPFDQLYKNVIPSKLKLLSNTEEARIDRARSLGILQTDGGAASLKLDVPVKFDGDTAEAVEDADLRGMINGALRKIYPRSQAAAISDLVTSAAADNLRAKLVADPNLNGKTVTISAPLTEKFDQYARGETPMTPNPRIGSQKVVDVWNKLNEQGAISSKINWALFSGENSRFPEIAGLRGALWGTFYALLACFLISFPVGIMAAVYLEEFAPKNRLTDFIEVNINNLAAVPSVVFGLLGLAVFLNFFNLPRSAPLVGGMVLSLMTLPTIIITTRASLKAVPPSIREAALGIGASKYQVMMHHVVPLAMPGILTGTIIGLAQALGETAPLLLIGMNAFITSSPDSWLDASTALPTQIYLWADSQERGFVARTSAAIIVLLGFLLFMNALAIFLRQRFERKW